MPLIRCSFSAFIQSWKARRKLQKRLTVKRSSGVRRLSIEVCFFSVPRMRGGDHTPQAESIAEADKLNTLLGPELLGGEYWISKGQEFFLCVALFDCIKRDALLLEFVKDRLCCP